MYSKKTLKRLEKQFVRDNDLGMPFRKSGTRSLQREEFMKQLLNCPDFVKTNKQNDKKFSEPLKQTFKQFKAFDYCVIAFITVIFGCLGYGSTYTTLDNKSETQISKTDQSLIFLTLLSVLTGAVIGVAVSEMMITTNKESNISSFYNRLSIRLFDIMRESYPDLDEKILKNCNPEMARVITALMMANMPESDTREIQNIAIKFARQLRDLQPNNKAIILPRCDKELRNALNIIEQNLLLNSQLQTTILSVYRGKVPALFTLQQSEKIR